MGYELVKSYELGNESRYKNQETGQEKKEYRQEKIDQNLKHQAETYYKKPEKPETRETTEISNQFNSKQKDLVKCYELGVMKRNKRQESGQEKIEYREEKIDKNPNHYPET